MSDGVTIRSLADRAAACAPLVDDAAIAVFRAAPALVGDRVRELIREAELSSGAIVIDMAEFITAGMLDRTLIEVRYRYGEVDGLDGVLTEWQRRGLMREGGPAPQLQQLCGEILRLRHEVAETIWDKRTASKVARLTYRAVTAGAGPLLAAGRELPLPASPQGRCHHALNLMRWARHGAHAAAWLTRGLTADEIAAMQADDDPQASRIVQAVERDTNVWCSPMLGAIGDDFGEWMGGLADLAGMAARFDR